jgi:hypothetical protein
MAVCPLGWAQASSATDVLARASAYVETLHAQLAGMVAEERYEQRERGGPNTVPGAVRRRVLQSDFLLFRPEGEQRYYGFRDVFEVDRRAVRDRDERLARLFLRAPASTTDRQIASIRRESALYNIGNVARNFNTPTYALLFLRESHKHRFTFEPVSDNSPPLGLDRPESEGGVDLEVIGYRETWPTTVLRGADGRNMPAQGRFWIEPTSGRVRATELVVEDPAVKAVIAVRFEVVDLDGDPRLVPIEMRERYNNRQTVTRIDGTATYSHFRWFSVEVTENSSDSPDSPTR